MKEFIVIILTLGAFKPILAQDYLRNGSYRGIWKATRHLTGEVFYFVLKDGVGYRITMNDEVAFAYTIHGNVFDFSMYDNHYHNTKLSTTLTYFDGNVWRYYSNEGGRTDTYEAVRIQDPLREINNNRLRIGVYTYVNGFAKWQLYDKNGSRVNAIDKAAYFRVVKEVRNEKPVVTYGLNNGDTWAMGIEGDTYDYIEGRYITGELQSTCYYHSYYYDMEHRSKGTVLDWNLIGHGPCLWYHRNGRLQQEGHYQDGVLYGTLKTYNANGILIKTQQGRPLSAYNYYVEDKILGTRN
ncbi:MAG: hypothetical protein U0Y10_09715 [Spirosomataceae bacterium]